MVFSSLTFLYGFFPLTIIVYIILRKQSHKDVWLTFMSLLFYGWGEPVFLLLMIFSSLMNYVFALRINKYENQRKLNLVLCIIINLGLLGVFKYADFFVSNINFLTGLALPLPNLPLPIGISFFTFQTMSYTIDVYRREVPVQRSYLKLLMYVSLFPQLIAGPIVRYSDVNEDIENRVITKEGISEGITRFCVGLGKKVLLANAAGKVVDQIFVSGIVDSTVLGTWLGIFMFSLQIYFDFSAYSDMAIGMGKMLGFHFLENFNYPYIAKSATDFWRRWHMSLSSFFRDYLYIPLGGNRKRFMLNILIVWFLTGLWHGASWNFILWGLFYGVILLIEKKFLLKFFEKIPAFFSHIYLAFITIIGWTIFYFTDFSKMLSAFKVMFGFSGAPITNSYVSFMLIDNFLLCFSVILCLPVYKYIEKLGARLEVRHKFLPYLISSGYSVLMLCLSTISLIGSSYNPFLYFRF